MTRRRVEAAPAGAAVQAWSVIEGDTVDGAMVLLVDREPVEGKVRILTDADGPAIEVDRDEEIPGVRRMQ